MEGNNTNNSCVSTDPVHEELCAIIKVQSQLLCEEQRRHDEANRNMLLRIRSIHSKLERQRYFNPY